MLKPQSSISSFTIQQYPSSPEGSLAHTFRCETRIANISYQIRSLSNFVSASKDLLDFATLASNFSIYQNQLARKTLESAGIVLFLWASCPAKLTDHKASYIELLRMLRANQGHVDTESQRRVRVLLMPLTSHFSTSPSPPPSIPPRLLVTGRNPPSTDSSVSNSQEIESTLQSQDDSSSSMLPPNEIRQVEPPNRSPVAPRHRRLWDSRELSYASVGPRHRSRSRSPHRFQQQSADEKLEQENVAPETTIAFRQAPRTQRFGIFLTGRSSMLGNYNRTDRNSSLPAH
ncbi:hypothetical protein JR316_0011029 [Psilocybe cubensis]|uniref:Uncharacterized protein n=1 Tax=Psilocybe cubensis TaxID=181762 RepID=A0ACB8GN87_PSICU|nr:hypothetical protein JR316_0011029 [Psilocybe cubensis]KAH9477113.1 hypothetical protein JR316_0011029 [Psilocybe cubensis]